MTGAGGRGGRRTGCGGGGEVEFGTVVRFNRLVAPLESIGGFGGAAVLIPGVAK